MNIFVLDESPRLAAIHQHDRHVVKMILESAQMLSVAVQSDSWYYEQMPAELRPLLYKPTHVNHPATIWARHHMANFVWLTIHADALCGEYTSRFRKVHKTYDLIRGFKAIACQIVGVDRFWTRNADRQLIIDPAILAYAANHSPFVYCGPTWYDNGNVVESYRDYYLNDKVHGNRWSIPASRCLPSWLAPHAVIHDRYPTVSANPPAKPFVPTGMAIPSFLKTL